MGRKVNEYIERPRDRATEHKLDNNKVNSHYGRNNQNIIFTCKTRTENYSEIKEKKEKFPYVDKDV